MPLETLEAIHIFPVRHHSPRSTAALRAFLETHQPEAVLVEGPSDAGDLIGVLVDEATEPPVAILGYRTEGEPGSSVWPFAAYSPEFEALRWARAKGRRAEFVDIPTGIALAAHEPADEEPEEGDPDDAEGGAPMPEEPDGPSIEQRCAEAHGFRSFEEFWEARFEAPDFDPDDFRKALVAWADLTRDEDYAPIHRRRDAFMLRRVEEVVDDGVAPERIVLVVGAAHASAMLARDLDPAAADALPEPVETARTLIPYSYPRLSEQLGYGAGNRAPHFYQKAHDAGCSFTRATLEVLIDFAQHLRLRGFSASLADTIEAYRLATMLAQLRDKAEPGLDELREATVATLCRGDASHVDGFLWKSVIGQRVGRVAERLGRNSLQEEFWRELRARRLPRRDAPESFVLKLNNEVEVGTSVFLHRLRICDVPYASYMGSHSMGSRSRDEEVGGYSALRRVRETWEAQWTPATDIALVERIALGDTFEQVTARSLRKRLDEARTTGAAAEVLLESVVTQCAETLGAALQACDELSAHDEDLLSLAKACRALSGLISYGTSRSQARLGAGVVEALGARTFERATLRLHAGCTGDDDAVLPGLEALQILHEVALSQQGFDRAAWVETATEVVESYAVHPSAAGLLCGLLFLSEDLDEARMLQVVGQRMSSTLEPEGGAAFLSGLLKVNPVVLLKSRALVAALDAFLVGIEAERFKDVLPALRRALADLGKTERRYLVENLVAVRGLGGAAEAVKAVVDEKDAEKLKEMSADLDDALGDLEDLL